MKPLTLILLLALSGCVQKPDELSEYAKKRIEQEKQIIKVKVFSYSLCENCGKVWRNGK